MKTFGSGILCVSAPRNAETFNGVGREGKGGGGWEGIVNNKFVAMN